MTPKEIAELISKLFQDSCCEEDCIENVEEILKLWLKYNELKKAHHESFLDAIQLQTTNSNS